MIQTFLLNGLRLKVKGYSLYLYIRDMEAYFEFTITCNSDVKDMLVAELAEVGYEGFVENEDGFSAFIPQSEHQPLLYNDLLLKYGINPNSVPHSVIQPQNWNAQWEANYEPIICLLYTSPSPRDRQKSRMPSSA